MSTNPKLRKKIRIRKKIRGTAERPRLSIYKSLRSLYAQLIDDDAGKTLASAMMLRKKNQKAAAELGTSLYQKAKEKNISRIVFDRNGYQYHGVVKSFAESLRSAGLQF